MVLRISPAEMSRRAVMVAGVATVAAGCNYDYDPNADNSTPAPPDDNSDQDTNSDEEGDDQQAENTPNPDEENGEDGEDTGAQALTSAGDVPAGGGVLFEKEQVVVTQPVEGEFKAFSSICTHQGCAVKEIAEGTINCPCHGSKFSIADGSVVAAANGGDPAQQDPLPEVALAVDGDNITLA